MVRVGILVLFVHDAADIIIETAKIVRYANWQITLNVLFVIFIVVWTATRLVYYPFWIMRSIWFDAPELIQVVAYKSMQGGELDDVREGRDSEEDYVDKAKDE
ncbi:Longevity-assurance protein [Necator americanus]|uniref:Longevity-assurance protein n=1 Tax=Necator americanus TaxID=51031 RepID=W2TCM7_NECAM|nr:Longevity-assurance protein [Necator americanus]ETN79785.1 Longevity-assurance protein [Necator americanus]